MEKIRNKYNRKIDLPYGAVNKISVIAGVSVFTVGNVLSGKSENEKVLLAIRDYLENSNNLKSEIKQLSNQLL